MQANEYALISQCVEDGIAVGYHRAFKHTDKPSESDIQRQIYEAVMFEICEWFSFPDIE